MPWAGGPRSSDSCFFTDRGRAPGTAGAAGAAGAAGIRLVIGFGGGLTALAGVGVTCRRGEVVGFCCCWPTVAGGSLVGLAHGFWGPDAAASLTLATAAAAPAPAARAWITVGCTTGGNSRRLAPGGLAPDPALAPPPPFNVGFFMPWPKPPAWLLPLTVTSGFFAMVAVLLFIRPVGR